MFFIRFRFILHLNYSCIVLEIILAPDFFCFSNSLASFSLVLTSSAVLIQPPCPPSFLAFSGNHRVDLLLLDQVLQKTDGLTFLFCWNHKSPWIVFHFCFRTSSHWADLPMMSYLNSIGFHHQVKVDLVVPSSLSHPQLLMCSVPYCLKRLVVPPKLLVAAELRLLCRKYIHYWFLISECFQFLLSFPTLSLLELFFYDNVAIVRVDVSLFKPFWCYLFINLFQDITNHFWKLVLW